MAKRKRIKMSSETYKILLDQLPEVQPQSMALKNYTLVKDHSVIHYFLQGDKYQRVGGFSYTPVEMKKKIKELLKEGYKNLPPKQGNLFH